MKLYILIEDSESFHKILPSWLKILLPSYSRARTPDEMGANSYYLFGAGGYPKILGTNKSSPGKNILGAAIETVNENNIDMLIVCLDADDDTVFDRINRVFLKINSYQEKMKRAYKVLVQNKCIETWMLGNRKMFAERPKTEAFAAFSSHYNVKTADPEFMLKPRDYPDTNSMYHADYLRRMLRERRIMYTKSSPPEALKTPDYFEEMRERAENTKHLKSFRIFLEFFKGLDDECKAQRLDSAE